MELRRGEPIHRLHPASKTVVLGRCIRRSKVLIIGCEVVRTIQVNGP